MPLSFLLVFAFSASAFSIGDWQCKAEGYDRFGQHWEMESERHIVIWEAQRDALRICRSQGYAKCRVFYCSDTH